MAVSIFEYLDEILGCNNQKESYWEKKLYVVIKDHSCKRYGILTLNSISIMYIIFSVQ